MARQQAQAVGRSRHAPADSESPAIPAQLGSAGSGSDRARSRRTATAQRGLLTSPVWAVLVVVGAAALVTVLAATWLTRAPSEPGVVGTPWLVEYGVGVGRLVLELSAAVTLGLSLLPKLVGVTPRPGLAQVLGLARRIGLVAAGIWAVSALLGVVLQTAEVSPGQPLTLKAIFDYVAGFAPGQALLVTAGAAVVYVAVAAMAARRDGAVPPAIPIVIAGFGLLPLTAAGHATSNTSSWHDLMTDSLLVHVLAVSAWTGGLVAVLLLVAPRRELIAATLPRFSKLATICLLAVAATGVINALIQLGTTPGVTLPGILLTSHYGQIVLAKTACVLVVAALGANIRFRLMPAIVRYHRAALIGWGMLEVTVMGIAFGLAVALSRAPVLG